MARTAEQPISYVLRDPKSVTPTPIVGLIRFNNDRIKVATGFKVLPAHWNSKTSRVKNVVDANNKQQINDWLRETEQVVGTMLADMKANRVALTKETVKARIDAYLKPVEAVAAPEKLTLFGFIEQFIDSATSRVNVETGRHVSLNAIQQYSTTLKGLRAFADTYRHKIDFDTIDLDFYDAFTTYLTTTKGFTINNVGKYFKNLKVFLNDASIRGIAVKQDYRSRRFKVVKEDTDAVYLSEAEPTTPCQP